MFIRKSAVKEIKHNDHVVFHITGKCLKPDGFPLPTAFRLRPKDGSCLSCFFLERWKLGGRWRQLRRIRKTSTRKLGESHMLAVVSCKVLLEQIESKFHDGTIEFHHTPYPPNISHACLQISDDLKDSLALRRIIANSVVAVYPAKR